jgi:hypothetical protein
VAAGAATKQYTAIFAIGAKLLGSFRGVMNAASARLAKLHKQTLAFGKSILKLTGVIGLFGTAIAGLGIGEVLRSIFRGATDQAKEARQRVNATIAAFMALRDIKAKGGYDQGKRELDIIYKQNEMLGKQGVLHTDIYNEMTKQLALGGVPPRQIKAMMGPLGDLLVKYRGVNATEEEGAELAMKAVKAIHGKTKGMMAFGMYLDANKLNSAGKKVQKTYQEIFEEILKLSSAEGTAGFNIARAADPEGKIQILQNRLQDMREEIGNKILPVQAKMAEAWLAILTPENTKLLSDAVEWLFKQLTRLVEYLKNDLLPYLKSDEGRAKLKQIGDTFIWIAQNLKPILITLGAIYVAMSALSVIGIIANPISLIIIAVLALVAAIVLMVTYWNEFKTGIWLVWKAATRIPIIGGFIESMGQQLAFVRDTIALVWDLIVSNKDKIISIFKTMGKIVIDWLLQPFKDIHSAYDKLVNAWKNRPKWLGGSGGAAAAGAAANAAAAPTAAAQAASAQIPLTPEGLKAVQGERADIVADLMRPELRNLVSATLATEAQGAEDQKNVLESLVNRGVNAKAAGTYKGVEDMIKSGFYGPYNRGETAAVMAKGLSDARSQQVAGMIQEIGAGRNALGGLSDQGMINEIHGAIKEQHGEDYYGLLKGSDTQSAAYKYSRPFAEGGIVTRPTLATLGERGPEAVLPLRGGIGLGTTVHFSPSITINGNASESEQASLEAKLRNVAREFIENFKRAQYQERRLSYESGYG